ncbi:MAG: hypothetical protein ACREOX_11450, partial [Stenotrophomonas sp.]
GSKWPSISVCLPLILLAYAITGTFQALSRWAPNVCGSKCRETLLRENRGAILTENLLLLGGLVAAISIYQTGALPNQDWRGMALGTGGGCVMALAWLAVAAAVSGRQPKEAYVAYAVYCNLPTVVVYSLILCCVSACVAASVSLLVG